MITDHQLIIRLVGSSWGDRRASLEQNAVFVKRHPSRTIAAEDLGAIEPINIG
jgi:hypothetical protein